MFIKNTRKSKLDNQKPGKKEMKEVLADHVRSLNTTWNPVGDEACPTGGIQPTMLDISEADFSYLEVKPNLGMINATED